jgi:hypothetical protein
MPVGRPTSYKEEYNDLVDDYLKDCIDSYDNGKRDVKLPTIGGFALMVGVNKQTLYNWGEEHPQFLDSLNKIVEEQQNRLINQGLAGNYNSTIAKLILSSNHGMSEKTENKTDITTGGDKIAFQWQKE